MRPFGTGPKSVAGSVGDGNTPPMQHAPRRVVAAVALVGLAATAVALVPTSAGAVDTDIAIDTSTVDFGSVDIGNTGGPISVTLTNTGGSPFGPINIFGGAPPSPAFNASQNCQGTTLPAGGSCTVNYTFSPTAAGPATDTSAFTISPDVVAVRRRGLLGHARGRRGRHHHDHVELDHDELELDDELADDHHHGHDDADDQCVHNAAGDDGRHGASSGDHHEHDHEHLDDGAAPAAHRDRDRAPPGAGCEGRQRRCRTTVRAEPGRHRVRGDRRGTGDAVRRRVQLDGRRPRRPDLLGVHPGRQPAAQPQRSGARLQRRQRRGQRRLGVGGARVAHRGRSRLLPRLQLPGTPQPLRQHVAAVVTAVELG